MSLEEFSRPAAASSMGLGGAFGSWIAGWF